MKAAKFISIAPKRKLEQFIVIKRECTFLNSNLCKFVVELIVNHLNVLKCVYVNSIFICPNTIKFDYISNFHVYERAAFAVQTYIVWQISHP